ncbi:MAG: purine-nucleoside phosphorylase [bacterium]
MATPHIAAEKGQIAKKVLFPGDPKRAEFIAKNFLKGISCYSTVRGMLGFTGKTESGEEISVQGSGMGQPSLAIYFNELADYYGIRQVIRVGSTGSLQKKIECREIILAMAACHDSNMNASLFPRDITFAPVADWNLLQSAYESAKKNGFPVRVGNIFATDTFYDPTNKWETLAEYNVLSIEMETAILYTLAAKKKVRALTILTVSDNLVTGERLTSKERETTFLDMFRLALSL